MSKYKEIYGVDISKDVFDVYGSKSGHNQFGIATFIRTQNLRPFVAKQIS